MLRSRSFVIALTCLTLSFAAARAQQADDTGNRVTALANRIAEMRELLDSRDPAIRDAAVEVALGDASPAIRGMAIYYALQRYPQLPLQFNPPAGSALRREDLPVVTIFRVEWERSGRAFNAYAGRTGALTTVNGQITADRLRLQFGGLWFSSEFAEAASRRNGRENKPVHLPGCEAELAPSAGRDSLTGVLRCPNMSVQPPLLLPLG